LKIIKFTFIALESTVTTGFRPPVSLRAEQSAVFLIEIRQNTPETSELLKCVDKILGRESRT
jgi:hypothetical protein